MAIFPLFITFAGLGFVHASNHWKVPCHSGECWYDIPSHSPNTFGGTLIITGPTEAISDITPAAGWVVLDCNQHASIQRVRIVCADEENSENCDHLFINGAENKIVRLPETCGRGPFARVVRASISSDQSLPSRILRTGSKRNSNEPQPVVHDILLDNNFAQAKQRCNRDSEIRFAIVGANEPGFPSRTVLESLVPVCRSRVIPRESAVSFTDQAYNSWNDWKKSASKTKFPILDVEKTFTLFEESISCPLKNGSGLSFSAGVKADLRGSFHLDLNLGYAASGTLTPPRVKNFALFGNLEAELKGIFELVGSASATLDSGLMTLLEVGIPGLDVPDILSIGPVFKLQGQGKARLDTTTQLSAELSYSAKSVTIYWPPSQDHPVGGLFTPVSNDLTLSIPPLYSSRASIEAHLIPKLEAGISAFGDRIKSTIYVLLDASVATILTVNPGTALRPNGCVDVVAGLDVHGGADANFFGLFDQSTVLPVYQKNFDLFKKCFKPPAMSRTTLLPISTRLEGKTGELTCPSGDPPVLVSITDL